jgi:hypothetical protein
MKDIAETKTNEIIFKYWEECTTDIDMNINKITINTDNRAFKQKSFRLKLITGALPVLNSIYTFTTNNLVSPVCLLCRRVPETQAHLVACPSKRYSKLDIITYAANIMDSHLKNSYQYSKLRTQIPAPSPLFLLDLIGVNQPHFLSTFTSHGVITNETRERFQENIEELHLSMANTWLTLTFDCWLTAIYEKVLKPRNKTVANPNTIPIPPLRLKIPKRTNIDRPDPRPLKRIHIIS